MFSVRWWWLLLARVASRSALIVGGSGQSYMQRGFMKFTTACPTCHGTGRLRGQVCPGCHGEGRAPGSETITVRIPRGIDSGSKVRVPGKGNAGINGGPAGDLYINLTVTGHPLFEREGSSIRLRIPVTVPEATLGAKIEVPTIYGEKRPSVFRLAPDPVRDSGLKAKERRLWAEIAGVTCMLKSISCRRLQWIRESGN